MFAPPPHGPVAPRHYTVPTGSPLFRISRHAGFRRFGPLDVRFDRYVMGELPIAPERRGIFYGAPALNCCIMLL